MRVLLVTDDGRPVLAVDQAEQYSLLDLAAHLREAITATAEGWDLPAPLPADPAGQPQVLAAVRLDKDHNP